ncbi:peroxisome biogenesis factor 10-like isoform X2 [Corticium candelabrum]|uniref:peroxisome biogenesis factor 10-like isoform X2 n=1 Tax=Corticium candelabrum TaxID=121492 RepID=UPI002E25DC2D|nr:peroxisome biogenesis factor 10-like isoform X2 [Corticium candelabrum]
MSSFSEAGQPELIRSNQKDLLYSGVVKQHVSDTVLALFGSLSWARWQRELAVLSDMLYFGLTTVCGYQTLGEEYCNIVQVDSSGRKIPSLARRLSLVLVSVCSPYIIHKLLNRLERLPSDQSTELALFQRAIPVIRHVISVLHRSHMAAFYLNGVFYHIAKRITGIRYLLARHSLVDGSSQSAFRLIGWLVTIQLAVSLGLQLWRWRASDDANQTSRSHMPDSSAGGRCDNVDITNEAFGKCSLCLSTRRDISATPCGHLFCWTCIIDWTTDKPHCPVCRDSVEPSGVVRLSHFVPAST